jgi:hypothetical protein
VQHRPGDSAASSRGLRVPSASRLGSACRASARMRHRFAQAATVHRPIGARPPIRETSPAFELAWVREAAQSCSFCPVTTAWCGPCGVASWLSAWRAGASCKTRAGGVEGPDCCACGARVICGRAARCPAAAAACQRGRPQTVQMPRRRLALVVRSPAIESHPRRRTPPRARPEHRLTSPIAR